MRVLCGRNTSHQRPRSVLEREQRGEKLGPYAFKPGDLILDEFSLVEQDCINSSPSLGIHRTIRNEAKAQQHATMPPHCA